MDDRPGEGSRISLTCDSCPFRQELADRIEAHRLAAAHEWEHATHFVSMQVMETG